MKQILFKAPDFFKIAQPGMIVKTLGTTVGGCDLTTRAQPFKIHSFNKDERRIGTLRPEQDHRSYGPHCNAVVSLDTVFEIVQPPEGVEIPGLAESKPVPPVITSATYSDGVVVEEDSVTFEGKKWTRKDLTAHVKQCKEILSRGLFPNTSPKKKVKKSVKKVEAIKK